MPSRVHALATGLGFLEGPVALGADRVAFCDGTRGLVLEYCAFLGSSLIVTASRDSRGELGTGLICSLETDAVSLPLFRGDLDR